MPKFTQSQQNVIDYRGKNMLVSASAGTGKTTVMIERIATLISEGADVSELVVVTFTNLAAAEMKNRLSAKLAEKRADRRIVEQMEKLDNASICTIHSFCSELLRNYFYVVDIDPSFAILDSVTVASLRTSALEEVFRQYFKSGDEQFRKVYKIFATNRKEENFKNTLMGLYDFSRCLEDFGQWYEEKKQKFLHYSDDNPIIVTVFNDIKSKLQYYLLEMQALQEQSLQLGSEIFASNCQKNVEMLKNAQGKDLQSTLFALAKTELASLGTDRKADKEEGDVLRAKFESVRKEAKTFFTKYAQLCRGQTLQQLWEETSQSVQLTDKLVEILQKFDEEFFNQKKQRGGVDFNDLEHLTLKLLKDEETAKSIRERYKLVFVDEYQDTNPVQEAIVSRLAQNCNLFMVGDIKQSIYGFRGCDPTIFLHKYQTYKENSPEQVEELNANFRSNSEILQFVNDIFNVVMTQDFGKVNYRQDAQLQGETKPELSAPSVHVDLVVRNKQTENQVQDIYDITAPQRENSSATQGEVVAQKVSQYVGMAYKDKSGNARHIAYQDIVVLVRSMKDCAEEIYNALVSHNIPVAANFKTESYANKEVRELINFMRVVDNPYNDIYMVGVCLSPIGGFSENQLAHIKIASSGLRIPFYSRMQKYAKENQNEISAKIEYILHLLEELRFYSRSATVDEVVLKILEKTKYHLYVQGFPNGSLRLRKLYSFVDSLKGANFSQSVDKFLSYLDDMSETLAEEGISNTNAVRLMTMHASKGLEFPVVIVADTQRNFKPDYPAVERNSQFGLAMKFYDFDSMRVFDTLGTYACGMFNKIKMQEEEMRLLYVALTRAKFVLNIVGTVSEKLLPKPATAANSHLDWILTAIQQKFGNLEENCKSLVSFVQEKPQFESHSCNLLCEQYTDSQAVMQKLSYRYPFATQTQMPSKIVSSALDREFIDLDRDSFEVSLLENNDRNAIGTAYHKVYQFVDYNATVEGILQTLNGLVNEGKVDKAIADKLDVQLIYQTLNNPELRKIMSQGTVFHEMPFMMYVPYNSVAKDQRFSDDVMLQGVIDLLVLGQDCAWVVDFKYSSHSVELLKKDYQNQLQSYRLAVEKICGVKKVECYILSVADNTLVKMSLDTAQD